MNHIIQVAAGIIIIWVVVSTLKSLLRKAVNFNVPKSKLPQFTVCEYKGGEHNWPIGRRGETVYCRNCEAEWEIK